MDILSDWDGSRCLSLMEVEGFMEDSYEASGSDAVASENDTGSSENANSSHCDISNEDNDLQIVPDLVELEESNGVGAGSENEDVQMGVGIHPLLFPHVVNDILSSLSADEVESARLVCKLWNVEACKVLKTKRVVVLLDTDAVRVYNNAMRNTGDFPHAQFELCMPDFTDNLDENLRVFWSTFGPNMRSLEFRQTQVYWRDLLQIVGERTPNLERLAFRHLPRNPPRSTLPPVAERPILHKVKELRLASLPSLPGNATERLTDLLKLLPNLEVIEFLPIKAQLVKSRLSRLIVDILQQSEVNLPKLCKLDLNLELSPEVVEGLASKRFQFQRLDITLSDGVKASSFKDLLMSLRSTLTELTITFPDAFSSNHTFMKQNGGSTPEESVQVLQNLKNLTMSNFKSSINFISRVPQLERLEFTTTNMAKVIPFGFKTFSGRFEHNLKHLGIKNANDTVPVAETLTIEAISRCFPYLTCLKLNDIDDDGLGVIYRNLPFLSEVEFTKATCTDQGLTGIPMEICYDMVETCTFIVVQAERYRRDLFIGSLQFLKKFAIVSPNISDASIALGLVDCKNLEELKIGSPKITDTGIIFVTDKFHKQLRFLDVSECTEITEQSKYYAGEKLMGDLKVAESPSDQPATTKSIVKIRDYKPDRKIVKLKKAPVTFAVHNGLHARYLAADIEFFEDHSEVDVRERAFVHLNEPDPNNRNRVGRIRDALRRNRDFMLNLQRMGIQQFRRLVGREFLEEENMLMFGYQNRARAYRRRLERERERDPQILQEGNNNGNGDGPPPAAIVAALELDMEEDGMRAARDHEGFANVMGRERFAEIHLAEIFRLGLRVEDVEFWLQNRPMFEREEVLNQQQVDAAAPFQHLEWLEDPRDRDEDEEDQDDNDIEVIRRLVINAFEGNEDLPFEG